MAKPSPPSARNAMTVMRYSDVSCTSAPSIIKVEATRRLPIGIAPSQL
jgi:hypothetical protein